MKKALLKILGVALIVCMLFTAVACSNGKWEGTTMKNWGSVKETGGFVAETDNYYYVINGAGVYTDDNSFGTPVKGALLAVDKNDLTKVEIVVPKLFVASDYNSGLFIDGDYVYYGTPSTDKVADGSTANTELHFMRTKLDGTDTKEFFKVSGISTEYRIVKGGSSVYIVYYDSDESAIMSYDTSSGTAITVAKTDAETETLYSLASYEFVTGAEKDVAVLYTTTVYAEPYMEDKIESGLYSRATENYTNLFAYKVGDKVDDVKGVAGTLIGKETGATYAISLANEYTFYTETDVNTSSTKTYGDTTANVLANKAGVEIKNTGYVSEENVIVSLDEVYSVSDNKVYRSTLVGNDYTAKQVVASKTSISSILAIENGQIYYVTSSNVIARTALNDESANEVVVSTGTVLTSWFDAEIFGNKLFYLDNSSLGVSYVKCVDLSATVVEEDTDDDDEVDYYYIDKEWSVSVMTEADKASKVVAEINNISNELESGVLPFETVNGELTVTSVTKARESYEALSKDAKKDFDETALTTLENYEKAIEMAKYYAKLENVRGYVNLSETEQKKVEEAYNEVKATIEEFMESDDFATISALLDDGNSTNYLWSYQQAVELFESEEE